ncbi:MAG: aggregation factor core [Pseudomonadota bacterium]
MKSYMKTMSHPLTAVIASALITSSAHAGDLIVSFVESAPKDRFTIANQTGCDLSASEIVLDLSQSAAGLIFDTTGAGAGVEVFQPFEIVAGAALLASVPDVSDGQNAVALNFKDFPADAELRFTVDVDDTLKASSLGQIRVSRSEISGAVVQLGTMTAQFDETATARLPVSCES